MVPVLLGIGNLAICNTLTVILLPTNLGLILQAFKYRSMEINLPSRFACGMTLPLVIHTQLTSRGTLAFIAIERHRRICVGNNRITTTQTNFVLTTLWIISGAHVWAHFLTIFSNQSVLTLCNLLSASFHSRLIFISPILGTTLCSLIVEIICHYRINVNLKKNLALIRMQTINNALSNRRVNYGLIHLDNEVYRSSKTISHATKKKKATLKSLFRITAWHSVMTVLWCLNIGIVVASQSQYNRSILDWVIVINIFLTITACIFSPILYYGNAENVRNCLLICLIHRRKVSVATNHLAG
ncbi:hypothetical protein TrispH2_005063 [Trichoplax sp. H2]|nr:hypothetical protein TrispH2_005063 [Trichoplax sp. H2]|eukprot:RDD43231.1 hypothetical protein TrispH2_005063 [Trichoplax sp. H2]